MGKVSMFMWLNRSSNLNLHFNTKLKATIILFVFLLHSANVSTVNIKHEIPYITPAI